MSLSYVCSDPLKTRLYFYQSQNAFSCLNMDLTWVLRTHKEKKKSNLIQSSLFFQFEGQLLSTFVGI